MDERTLIERAVRGDASAFNDLMAGQEKRMFAVAMRMVSSLDDVRRPFSAPDIPKNFVRDGVLQLPQAFPELFSRITGEEPRIPFREYREEEYRAQAPFDFVTLALSPRYAPESADKLADVIREYIREI